MSVTFPSTKTPLFMDRSLKNNFLSTKSTVFMDGDHSAPDERPVSEGSQMVTKKPLRRVADTSSLRKFLFEEIKDIYCTLIVKSGLWILNLSKRS